MKTLKSRFTSLWFCLACQHRISCCFMKYNSSVISRCDWLFSPSAREVSPGNCSNYKSTRERVDYKGLYGRRRLHLMGSWYLLNSILIFKNLELNNVSLIERFIVYYRGIFLLVSCILTRSTGSPKYGMTRKNIPRYYTLNRPIIYMYCV